MSRRVVERLEELFLLAVELPETRRRQWIRIGGGGADIPVVPINLPNEHHSNATLLAAPLTQTVASFMHGLRHFYYEGCHLPSDKATTAAQVRGAVTQSGQYRPATLKQGF